MDLPSFELPDPSGETYTAEELMGENGLVVVFTCNHCPYAQAGWQHVLDLAPHAKRQGLPIVAINPNIHPEYPEDSPENMKTFIAEHAVPFPYLVDETQDVAQRFQATCTPDIYVFNSDKELVYHGRIGEDWREDELQTEELKAAIDAVAADAEDEIPEEQVPSYGCSIKWRDQ